MLLDCLFHRLTGLGTALLCPKSEAAKGGGGDSFQNPYGLPGFQQLFCLHPLRKPLQISQNTFGQSLQNMPKAGALGVCVGRTRRIHGDSKSRIKNKLLFSNQRKEKNITIISKCDNEATATPLPPPSMFV